LGLTVELVVFVTGGAAFGVAGFDEVGYFVVFLGGGYSEWVEDDGGSEGVVVAVGGGLVVGVYVGFNAVVFVVGLMASTVSAAVVGVG
jgi:hypothetical protein